ncbi:hypothetical protein Tco_0056385, partial [Tanacetum coccineum]
MDDGDAAAVMATAAGGDDEVGVVMAAWVGFGGEVAARGSGDRVDPVMGNIFGVRRKSFPVAGGGGRRRRPVGPTV